MNAEIRHERIWLVATRHIEDVTRFLEPRLPSDSDSQTDR